MSPTPVSACKQTTVRCKEGYEGDHLNECEVCIFRPDTEGSLHGPDHEIVTQVVGGELGHSPGQGLLLPLSCQVEVVQSGVLAELLQPKRDLVNPHPHHPSHLQEVLHCAPRGQNVRHSPLVQLSSQIQP